MKAARQEILDRLKDAVYPEPYQPDFHAPVFLPVARRLNRTFKETLEAINGKVHLFETKEACITTLKDFLSEYKSDAICCRETRLKNMLDAGGIQFSGCKEMPESVEVGITGCEYLIAQTGSVMVSSVQEGGRQLFAYPPVHLVIAEEDKLVDTLDRAYRKLQEKYKNSLPSQISLISGPSRTADIEKTLILGAHGPRELHIFLYKK